MDVVLTTAGTTGGQRMLFRVVQEAIRQNDLAAQFPERTEADLFIWSWQNNKAIEELELDDTEAPAAE